MNIIEIDIPGFEYPINISRVKVPKVTSIEVGHINVEQLDHHSWLNILEFLKK